MATAKVRKPKPRPDKIVLTLTQKEADYLRSLVGLVNGDNDAVYNDVWRALSEVTEFVNGLDIQERYGAVVVKVN